MINGKFFPDMLYPFYELNHFAAGPWNAAAKMGLAFWSEPGNLLAHTPMGRQAAAALHMVERATRRYDKPDFEITSTTIGKTDYAVTEDIVWQTPFCNLLHFAKPALGKNKQPKLLMVAPMSGHYATLLRGTIEAMLPHFDCYVTDWLDARDVPVEHGAFDLDDYTETVIAALHHLGTRAHVMAVCQPSVPVLAAASLMSMDDDPLVPLSMVLMGGPIDTRVNPTSVNKLAEGKSLAWFEKHSVMPVAGTHAGVGRKVYPGFMQLSSFLAMNPERHLKSHRELFHGLAEGKPDESDRHVIFYDEYMAVMDLTAEFYLQTVERVFLNHDLPNGTYRHRERLIDPAKITKTALLTIEAERDDISGVGQTEAAHKIVTGLPAKKKMHHLQMGVGHYGVFSGSKFRAEVAPRIVDFLTQQKA